MTPRRATVWHGQTPVGVLSGALRFTYDADWLSSGFAISLSLPLSEGEMDGEAFFSGLLPEGLARQRICRQYGLPESDDAALLLAIGRDCAGALAVLPEGEGHDETAAPVTMTEEDLARLVATRGQALPTSSERIRFSLAGAQDKVAVILDADGMRLPTAQHPSSHILKFESMRWVCFAEHAANELARELGLNVPRVRYRAHPEGPYLEIERYDRGRDGHGTLFRLHQEDMMQALGLSATLKYQEHGGPDLGLVSERIRRHSSDPVRDVAALRDWQIFNYLAGNSDGHAKNLALLYHPETRAPRLSPLYDLACIEHLNRLGLHFDRKLAFYVGGNNLPEQITKHDWNTFAKALGVPPKSMLSRLQALAERLPQLARNVRQRFADEFGDNQALGRFEESIADRCAWTLRSVFGRG
ncbi:MAG: type II toxin-antitoxin system HipA family toxin [Myxococcales bacterium]|nr:type II toxin-antitoxin system HipA family toxin [Myxococcales bacterium]MCB9579029.1 type II toxin-antitoxin system HipA family toxin [Polyangiaceae bacterium]